MSLRSKIVLILVTVVVVYTAFDNGLVRFLAGHAFGRWEHEGAAEDLERVRRRIDSELADLCGKGRVIAGQQAMARFVAGSAPDFAESDLGRPALERADVDLFYVCDAHGKVLWSSVLDPTTREPMRLLEFPREALSPNHAAILFKSDQDHVAG